MRVKRPLFIEPARPSKRCFTGNDGGALPPGAFGKTLGRHSKSSESGTKSVVADQSPGLKFRKRLPLLLLTPNQR
jgi:hypothetical protein